MSELPDDQDPAELRHLLDLAHESLDAADVLLQEGFAPQATSEAYYAMHRAASAMLLTRGIVTRTHRGTADELWEAFVDDGALDAVHAERLRDAMELREDADYGTAERPDAETAAGVIEDAKAFVEVGEGMVDDAVGES